MRIRTRAGLIVLFVALSSLPCNASAADTGNPGTNSVHTNSTAPEAGGFLGWPITPQPVVLTPFAPPANPYGAGHRGVDLSGAAGVGIQAAGSGVVIFAGTLVDRGVISIEHAGGLRTTYEPVTAVVTKGARVIAGQQIGSLDPGHPSCLPASCLHWGAKIGDVYLDPLSLLRPLRVRLKPWGGLADTPP